MKIYGIRCSWYQCKYDKFGAQWIPAIYRHVCDDLNNEPNDLEMMGEWYQEHLFGYYNTLIDRVLIKVEIADRGYHKGIFESFLFHKRVKCLDRRYYKVQNIINVGITCYGRIRSMKVKLGLRRVVNFKGTKGEM